MLIISVFIGLYIAKYCGTTRVYQPGRKMLFHVPEEVTIEVGTCHMNEIIVHTYKVGTVCYMARKTLRFCYWQLENHRAEESIESYASKENNRPTEKKVDSSGDRRKQWKYTWGNC